MLKIHFAFPHTEGTKPRCRAKSDKITFLWSEVTCEKCLAGSYEKRNRANDMVEDIARRLVNNLLPVFKADNKQFDAIKFSEFVLNGGSRAKL